MAIKHSRGRLSFSDPFEGFIAEQLEVNGIETLDVKKEHAIYVHNMPFHHKDPFDRLLIAQSMIGLMPLISKDSEFDSYSVQRLW
jgi:PIN domain nuclease of toxin-antitoxin system